MSEEMAVTDKGSGKDEPNADEAVAASASVAEEASSEPPTQTLQEQAEQTTSQPTEEAATSEEVEEGHARKRRASSAFSNPEANEEFRGFDQSNLDDSAVEYNRVLDRMEAEISAVRLTYTPVRTVTATPPAPGRLNKRLRQDTMGKSTDGSRPSSALSSRSDGDGVASSTDLLPPPPPPVNNAMSLLVPSSAASSPAQRSGRRGTTTEISSPLFRVPLEKGWKRELVYRAALDSHSRRNADIYYYTPAGKKLRSTREVSEHLSGTGLTLENFSFFKEPLGVDDPEKEIIRDAKMQRRVDSPVTTTQPTHPVVEGKRTPKPKAPKGASPEPATPKSPPAKIKVKSVGSRLSNTSTPPAQAKQPAKKQTAAAPQPSSTDNNNSTTWKKPRLVPPPPPLTSRPPPHATHPDSMQSPPQVQQPCSISCGGGMVPSLACRACLCLYHPPCVGHSPTYTDPQFLCKNCKTSTSPPLEPPPLTHKSGVPGAAVGPRLSAPATPLTRRPSASARPRPPRPHKPVLLTMKVSGSDAGGQRVWSVKPPQPAPSPGLARALALRPTLPQSLATMNGKRFIVVPRNVATQPPGHSLGETKANSRLSNGATSPAATSPRRRGRSKPDDTDYFTLFYQKSKERNYNVVVQIFQYLGMRDLAHCARVCKLWRELAATPLLWRHVRMKNSHVSDWNGLTTSLKRRGTTRLDLRKMLLPQNDAAFWDSFAQHIPTVDTLERIEMCRCPASAVEAVCNGLPSLVSLSALAVRDGRLDPWPLASLTHLQELRLKSMAGLSLTRDLSPLAKLTNLQHLSLTSIKELGLCSCEIVGSLKNLISLELGECTFRASFGAVLSGLKRLQRLRLERGTAECAAPALLRALALLPELQQLELVNFDVKVGFDDALAECKNIQRLLIIPTYVSQSATTNKQVLSGVLRLKDTLTHLMWGVTIELLRVTELFIDQCDQAGDSKKKDIGECIPVLKPVPGCKLPDEHHVAGPPQVEILPLPTLQRLLSAQLPNTKLKLLRIPFHATWRQSLADFQ